MGASSGNQVSQSLSVQICQTNQLSQQIMEDLILIAGRKKDTGKIFGYINLCVVCEHLAHGWLITTCPNEHVETSRICNACRNQVVSGTNRMCTECNRAVWDWAVKADMEHQWWTSWGWEK